jgi:hypothetical protein
MAKQPFDAFLPSGALEEPLYKPVFGSRSSTVSPLAVPPRSFTSYIPSHNQEGRSLSPKPHANSSELSRSASQRQNGYSVSQQSTSFRPYQHGRPLSPPFSRTPSTEDGLVAQIQGLHTYSKHLREVARGERAHMEADRARMEELMAEERALWDQEREYMKARIEKLEFQLAAYGHQTSPKGLLETILSPPNGHQSLNGDKQPSHHSSTTTSASSAMNGNKVKAIPQESGRNPDGTPFYAPAPRNPSRTFETSQDSDVPIASLSSPRDMTLLVTSHELTQADFVRSPPTEAASREGSVAEVVDISYLQPELEGVHIKKTSTAAPTFSAKILSPSSLMALSKSSSRVTSPNQQPARPQGQEGLHRSGSKSKPSTLEIINAPENRRLTMHAGHTPNHSVHKFDMDSGNATPTQNEHRRHEPSLVVDEPRPEMDENNDEDPKLKGPLGLLNIPEDEIFLTALTNKLEEVKQNGLLSPSQLSVENKNPNTVTDSSSGNPRSATDEPAQGSDKADDEDSEAVVVPPVLKVKASMNFGRPFGSL